MDYGYGFPMFGGIISIFLFIAGVMALFIPFWVYRIRNEVIEMNRQLSKLVEMQGYQGGYETLNKDEPGYKTCMKCGKKNRAGDAECLHCGETLYG